MCIILCTALVYFVDGVLLIYMCMYVCMCNADEWMDGCMYIQYIMRRVDALNDAFCKRCGRNAQCSKIKIYTYIYTYRER